MGKVKSWLMQMEEDALHMDRDEWCAEHGESCIEIWNEARRKAQEEGYDQEETNMG